MDGGGSCNEINGDVLKKMLRYAVQQRGKSRTRRIMRELPQNNSGCKRLRRMDRIAAENEL